jgi:hypothetical protein
MTRRRPTALALAVAIALSGCQARERASAPGSTADSAEAPPVTIVPFAIDSTGVEGALDVLRRYYQAIDERDYRRAYALWARDGAASGQVYDAFAAGFAQTANTGVKFTGPAKLGAAAGTIYAEVPVRVDATTTAGELQHFEGTYVLRRANDVPGATPEQLRWHIDSAKLAAAP